MTAVLMMLAAAAQAEDAVHHVELTARSLAAIVGDNEPMGEFHRKLYNGVFAMTTPTLAESPFVPFYAGLNLEHYFDARARHEDARVFLDRKSVV